MMKTNTRLKHFLKERGISQAAVAEGIGMKKTAFNAILNDHAELRADTLENVCKFIGVTPGYFFKYRVQENGVIPHDRREQRERGQSPLRNVDDGDKGRIHL